MDELLALLERYAPGYHHQLQGVSSWNLDKLEEVFGQPLPEFYRDFALAMGKDGGPLLADVDAYDPFHIADLYQVVPPSELPPRRFLYVLGDPSLDAQHYWLDLETPSEDADGRVLRIPFGKEAWKRHSAPLYANLREMLFMWAMSKLHLPSFPLHAAYYRSARHTSPEDLPEAEAVARIFERLGFVRLPYPRRCLLLERDDAAISLYRSPDEPGFSFRVGMQTPEELRRFQAVLEDIQGLAKDRRT